MKIFLTLTVAALWSRTAASSDEAENIRRNLVTEQRPDSDFISRQGTYCLDEGYTPSGELADGALEFCPPGALLFIPPIANFIGWGDPDQPDIFASIDYAGLANQYTENAFGTTTTGSVTERELPDGRALVKVNLHIKNALTWVSSGSFTGDLLFGARAEEAAGDESKRALGDFHLKVEFVNVAPGYDLPDLIQILSTPELVQEVNAISINGVARGPLSDGTPGKLVITQIGLLDNPNCGLEDGNSAVTDCFPVEKITLTEV